IVDSLIAIGYASAKEKVNILRKELNAMAVRRMPRPEEAQTLYHLRSVPDGIAHSTWYDRAHDIDVLYSKAVQIANEGKHARVEVLLHSDATAEIVMSPSTRVTSINVVGNTLLSNAVLAGLESRWIGTPINEWTQRGISEYLLEDYRKQGFSLAQVDSLYILPDGAIHMWVDEGVVERISVRGNTRTNHVVILREIPVRAGSVFRMADMKRGMENLFALDLFHSVAYDILRNDDQIHLVIRVVERPSKILQTGLLVDNERNAQLGLLLRDANFLGSGTEIAASFFGGHNIREYAVQFSSNRLFYTPFNTRIRAFYGFRDYNGYADVPDLPKHRFARDIALVYRSIDYGAAASFGIYVQRFGHLQAKLRYAQQSIRTDQLRNPDVDPITEEHRLVEWGLSSTVDTQDKYPYPNKGILFEGEYTSALRALGSEIAFTRLTLGYDFYVPVIPDHLVLHPRIRFGYGDKTMPRTEEFRIGGLYSFIGMRENEYNGRQIILGGMELRYALPVRILFDAYLSMRYDLGRTWANPELVKLEDLRHGVGLQLGLDTPIGPADFAVGRSFYFLRANPVTPVKWGPVHLYFTIGARL
ncbi:MAG: BamA/TamA family outer membrane protein, partial [Bacteroidetes bacterium]|nr:BamA/TamA family outer membrane protein [Bacteroidota bacterium]